MFQLMISEYGLVDLQVNVDALYGTDGRDNNDKYKQRRKI